MRRILTYALLGIAGLVGVLLAMFAYLQTEHGRGLLIAQIEAAAAGDGSALRIGAIDGFVPFDFAIRNVAMSDKAGEWLAVDRVEIAWSPMSLVGGVAEIDRIVVGRVDLSRTPNASAEEEAPAEEEGGLALPSLPVAIELHELKVTEIALGAPILGEPALFEAAAQASLGDADKGLHLQLNLQRLDGGTDIVDATVDYLPATDRLDLALVVQEPKGGLLTKSLGLLGEPNLKIDAFGDGPLSDWQGSLAATLNGNSLLDIQAHVTGAEDRVVALQMNAAPAPLLPADLAALTEGGLQLTATLGVPVVRDAIDIREFQLDSVAAHVSMQGRLGITRESDLAFSITADNAAALASLLPDITWQAAALDGELTGTWPMINLTASASVSDLVAAGNRIGSIDLAATLESDDFQNEANRFDLLVDAAGIDLGTPEANALLAEGVTLAGNGAFDLDGTITLDSLDVAAGALALAGQASAENWGEVLSAEAQLNAPDLAKVPAAGGMTLAGALAMDMTLDLSPAGMRVDAAGNGTSLVTGIAAIDGVLGAAPQFSLVAARDSEGRIDLETFDLTGKAVTANAKGVLAEEGVDLKGRAALGDLAALDPAARGKLDLVFAMDGTLSAPRLRAGLTSPEILYDGIRTDNLVLEITAENLAAAPQAKITGSANVIGQPARLTLALLSEPESGALRIDDLALRHGPSAVSGKLRLLAGIADGEIKLAIADIAPYAPLAGSAMSGAVMGNIGLRNRGGQQDVAIDLGAEDLALADAMRIASLKLAGTIGDATGAQNIEARLDVASLAADQVQFDQVALTASGNAAALDLKLDASGPEARIAFAGDVARNEAGIAATIAQLSAEIRGETLALRGPARITQSGETIEIAGFDLGYGEGGVTLDGRMGPEGNDVDLAINRLSLGLLRMVDPTQDIGGEINGRVVLAGSRADPTADIDLAAKDVTFGHASGISLALDLKGDWRDAMLRSTGKLTFSTGGGLDINTSLGLGADPATGAPQLAENAPFDARVSGDLDLALVNRFIAGGADRISGKMRIDLGANGTLAQPLVAGNATLSEGRYENVRYGIKLKDMTAELRGDGDRFEVASFSARTPGKGQISANGGLSLEGDMPIEVALKLVQAQVINTDTAFAIVDADLRLVGTAKSEVALTGTVTVPKSELRIPDRLPASVQEIAYVEVNTPPERAQKLAEEAKPPAKTLDVALDIKIDIPQKMAIRGRGLDAEMEGALAVTGTADQPIVTGEVAMRRGTLDIVGRHLDFSRGKVEFDGGEKVDPILDFVAGAKAENYDIAINVGGRASFPKITLSSTPALPEDEVLSRLLFGKASGSLTAFEALQLAQAAAELAGVDTGVGMLDAVRGATGLDRLSVDSGDGTTGPSLSAGRYVSDRVYVGVRQGAAGNSSAATVEVEVTPNVKVETELGADASKAGVNWEWDY
ncbi:translocation/assembly module TamB domain-containing protein [Dongia sp.]|uniref:translocation/assembly module TamB domain-containing protein n=1 Tax=Dongia sp. TaxID=1977262 RepID=UPI0035AFAD0A